MPNTRSRAVFEQAIFTSCKRHENEGYQVAAASNGIDESLAKAIATWSPTHDSLQPEMARVGSLNVAALGDDRIAISVSRRDDLEYSGRGETITSHVLVADADAFALFGSNPIRILEAALCSDWPAKRIDFGSLPLLSLVGCGSPINLDAVARVTNCCHLGAFLSLLEQFTSGEALGITNIANRLSMLDALYSCTPLPMRIQRSATTGLLPSQARKFQLHFLPAEVSTQQQFSRSFAATVIDPTQPWASKPSPSPMARSRLPALLGEGKWSEFRREILAMV